MNSRLLELATRHGALKARIDEQRRSLASQSVPLEAAFAQGDRVLEGVDWLKHHPAAVFAAVATVVVARPKRAWRWAKRGLFVWRGWQAVKTALTEAP